eukprot:10264315-Alexandrium_andersonii.AAC.1
MQVCAPCPVQAGIHANEGGWPRRKGPTTSRGDPAPQVWAKPPAGPDRAERPTPTPRGGGRHPGMTSRCNALGRL